MINEKLSDKEKLAQLRHSAAHLLAHAVSELYPKTKLTIGPATEEGFFYDFLPEQNFKEEDLPLLEARMHEISKRNLPLIHKQVPKAEARKLYKDNQFKLELIDKIPDDTVGIATQGEFNDLCRGGHVETTGMIQHFKLLTISGAYWRADRSGQTLQRITGTACWTDKDLAAYLKRREELEMYDHRRLGKQLDLFSFHDEGVGFPFFHPKGKSVVNTMVDWMRKLRAENGYYEVSTPTMLNEKLWHQSGHWAFYKDNMYFSVIDETTYALKPMNCPGSFLIYKTRPHSYRELPLRFGEFGHVHRHELSGALHGLIRVRAFTQDDVHIYCTPDQIESQVVMIIEMIKKTYTKFGFESFQFAVSTKPEKAMGSDELWEKATNALKKTIENANVTYVIQEGEGAFYGPKIDVNIQDSMGRNWQCGTIQVDFFQPENFDLTYVAASGAKERPVVIHSAVFGSLERFFAIVLEHHKGALPFWLAPVQATVLTITDAQKEYGQKLVDKLKEQGIRVIMDESSDPISGKIKSAQMEKIPWMLVVGNKEAEANTITLRYLNGKQEFGLTLDGLIKKAQEA